MRDSGTDPAIFDMPHVGACRSYRPGHATHWIMANIYQSHPALPAVILDLDGTAITIEFDGRTVVWHHHEPDRLLVALQRPTTVEVIEACTAILIGQSSRYWFYCSANPLGPCSYPEK